MCREAGVTGTSEALNKEIFKRSPNPNMLLIVKEIEQDHIVPNQLSYVTKF
jgi:hypothetical protein